MAINSVSGYGAYTNAAAYRAAEGSSAVAEQESSAPRTAAEELAYLQKKFGSGVSIMSGSYQAGTAFGSGNTTNIMIHPAYLQKMANDPQAAAECEEAIAYFEKYDQQFRASQAAAGWTVKGSGWACDKDGNWSGWCAVEKTGGKSYTQKLAENMEKILKERMENKAEQKETAQTREAERKEKAELKEKLEKACRERLGDKFGEVSVMDAEDSGIPALDVRA